MGILVAHFGASSAPEMFTGRFALRCPKSDVSDKKKHKLELVNITLVKGFWLPATLNPMRPLMMMKSASFQVINVMFIASRISCPDSREIRQEWLLIFLWKAKVGTFLQKKV